MRNLFVFFVISLAPTALCRWRDGYGRPTSHTAHRPKYQTPLEIMVDVTNDLATLVLQDYAHSKGNFAFSPYGVASVLVVLYEGARGETAKQIHHALRLPWNKDVTRVGFRDIHRTLVSYFTHEGYLSGMTLSKNHTALREDYKRVLRFYGYDVDLVKHPDVPMTGSTAREMSNLPSTLMGTTPMTRKEPTTGTTSMVREEASPGTTPMVKEEMSSVKTTMVREEKLNGTTSMEREEILTGTTPMVKEEMSNVTTTMVREGGIPGTTPMVKEEMSNVTTTMVREGGIPGTTPMVKEEMSNVTTTMVREGGIPGTTPMVKEEMSNVTTTMVREGGIPGTTPMVKEDMSNVTTTMVREEGSSGTTPMVKEEMSNVTTTMVREGGIPGTTPMVKEEMSNVTTTVVREEGSSGTTPMVKEEMSNVKTTMVREEGSPGTTLMVKEEMSNVKTTMVREEGSPGTTPMVKEEKVTVTPVMVREEKINGTTSMVREETTASSTSMVGEVSNISAPIVREEKITTITGPSSTETYSIFTVIFPTTPEPENSTSEEGGNKNNTGEGNAVTQVRMPSSTKATSEDELEDITTTTPAASAVEHTTAVEETKDPTIYPSGIFSDDDDEDQNNTTTDMSWNMFTEFTTTKPEEENVRAGDTLPAARSTLDTALPSSPSPKTEEAFEELPTTLAPPAVSSSTEPNKEITYGGKAITLVAKSPSKTTSSDDTAKANDETPESAETRSLPTAKPSPSPEATPTENLAARAGEGNSNLTENQETNRNLTDPMPTLDTRSGGSTPEANDTNKAETPKSKRSVRSIRRGSHFPDVALELDNSMYDSHVNQGSELYTQLPRYTFLVDGVMKEDVPVMSYTTIFPFAYIDQLNSLALEFPLDDSRYKLLILLPTQPRGLPHLIHEMKNYPLRQVYEAMRPTRVNAIIPSFMVEGFVILTPALQQLGIWDVFDPRRCNLSGMSADPELYVRNVEQSITVVIRNYMEVLDIHTRTLAARKYTERFFVTHPFLYFVLDTETHVALMAGKIVDPLSSRIY